MAVFVTPQDDSQGHEYRHFLAAAYWLHPNGGDDDEGLQPLRIQNRMHHSEFRMQPVRIQNRMHHSQCEQQGLTRCGSRGSRARAPEPASVHRRLARRARHPESDSEV